MRTYNCTRFSRLGELACINLNLCCTVLMNWEMLLVFDLFCRGVEMSLQCSVELRDWLCMSVLLVSSLWLNSLCRWTESSFLSVISRRHHEKNLLIVISRHMELVSVINLKRHLSFFLLPNISFSLLISLSLYLLNNFTENFLKKFIYI